MGSLEVKWTKAERHLNGYHVCWEGSTRWFSPSRGYTCGLSCTTEFWLKRHLTTP